ncbi:hypothetical protein L6452_01033 [Arctium lappa]|uniref:Uncharacterized protein n=1 Tax=Arctium lappa TaxID=4217 RepID=A0ACB9FF52_ARCLA|nr:hypothetical protein L6452_01033 [Arctium lappa]
MHNHLSISPAAADHHSSMTSHGIEGSLLEVTVVSCNNLKDAEWISTQDPYVCVEYGSNRFSTRTCKVDGGKNPTFQEKFVYSLVEGVTDLNITVWNSNILTHDDLIGSRRVPLTKALSQGFDDNTWPLKSKTGRHEGEVRLIMHYSNANKPTNDYAPSAPPYVEEDAPSAFMYAAPPPSASYPPSPYPSHPQNSGVYPPAPYPPHQAAAPYPPHPFSPNPAPYGSHYPPAEMGAIGGEELMKWEKMDGVGNGNGNEREEKILVLVRLRLRLRPLNEKEISRNDVSDWECINDTIVLIRNSLHEKSMFPTAYSFGTWSNHVAGDSHEAGPSREEACIQFIPIAMPQEK